MDFALVYLTGRFFYRLRDFFHHWYVDASRHFAYAFTAFLESLDRTFAVKITLKYFFYPLYKDYSVIGRVLGVIFRSGRIIIGVAVYAFWTALFGLVYLAWILIPPILIFYVLRSI
jgi:hypothetical protein